MGSAGVGDHRRKDKGSFIRSTTGSAAALILGLILILPMTNMVLALLGPWTEPGCRPTLLQRQPGLAQP